MVKRHFQKQPTCISLKYTLLATNHTISSRGLVAGEHQNSYLHEQVSQERLVLPRENHHTGTCCMHIPVQPTTYSMTSREPGLCPTYQLSHGPFPPHSFCISWYMPPGNSNTSVPILEKSMGTLILTEKSMKRHLMAQFLQFQ